MADYHFVTRWHLGAPIDAVWDAIADAERWPTWWKGVERVEALAPGDAAGVGAVRRMTWKSALPYRLVFDVTTTRVERPNVIVGSAEGELVGTGRWDIREAAAGGTDVTYFWDIATTRRWMNVLAPLAGPAFRWNHDWVMANGERGLAALLATSGADSAGAVDRPGGADGPGAVSRPG